MLHVLLLIWAITATIFLAITLLMLVRNPFPFPDRGHRTYGVPSEEARHAVLKVFLDLGNLKERFTFDSGPTHQTLMWDGYTVINRLEGAFAEHNHLSGNGPSIPVKDPMMAAEAAKEILIAAGYATKIEELIGDDLPPNHVVIVLSDAFNEWVLVFRRPALEMPRLKKRKALQSVGTYSD